MVERFVLGHQPVEHTFSEGERLVQVRKALSMVEIFSSLPLGKEEVQFIENELVDEAMPRLANQSAPDRVLHRQGVQNF